MKPYPQLIIGWREWVALPELGIPAIKAKVDTGARSSAIHTFMIEPFESDEKRMVRFGVHPMQRRNDIEIFCEAEVLERRSVTSSTGHRERRYVIRTPIQIGHLTWSVEMTLAKRDNMNFRMLLGRTAIRENCLVHSGASYLTGPGWTQAYQKKLEGDLH